MWPNPKNNLSPDTPPNMFTGTFSCTFVDTYAKRNIHVRYAHV